MKSVCYDKFKCIAGKCSMTCCEGWEIERSDSPRCMEMLDEYYNKDFTEEEELKMLWEKDIMRCPLLTSDGLCSLVIRHSDEALSKACRVFPRNIYKNKEGEKNYDLSFGCPEVVDLYNKEKNGYPLIDDSLSATAMGRCAMSIFHTDSMPLDIRMLAIYLYLNDELEEEEGEDNLRDNLSEKSFTISEYLNLAAETVMGDEPFEDFKSLNSSFLNLIVNYSTLPIMKPYLDEIYLKLDEADVSFDILHKMFLKFQVFKEDFDEKLEDNPLIKSVFEAKLFEALEHAEDVYEMEQNFEAVLYEFAFLRYAIFANAYIYATYPDYDTIRALITCMSRMIGHNEESFFDFISEEPELISVLR